MNKRIALKTALICTGFFIILTSLALYYFSKNYQPDTEQRVEVIIAAKDIKPGDIIRGELLSTRIIKASALTNGMQTDASQCIGTKAINIIPEGEYLTSFSILERQDWSKSAEKIIIIPMDIESRLANMIKKGSLIDIRVLISSTKLIPQTVISKIRVENILDENGLSLGDNIGSKKSYAVFKVDRYQSDRIYAASQLGKLVFELYCDLTQKKVDEDFVIPLMQNSPKDKVGDKSE